MIGEGDKKKVYPLFGEDENAWYHIIFQYEPDTTRIFVNQQVSLLNISLNEEGIWQIFVYFIIVCMFI